LILKRDINRVDGSFATTYTFGSEVGCRVTSL